MKNKDIHWNFLFVDLAIEGFPVEIYGKKKKRNITQTHTHRVPAKIMKLGEIRWKYISHVLRYAIFIL